MAQQLDAAGGFWAALVSVIPALGSAGHLLRLSTSAGLCRTDTGATFPGSGGLHGYVAITDGADAVRFLTTLHARCWLAGFGWMDGRSAGQLLERSIIDRMVGAAERLVFEGPPVVEPPLRQDAAARRRPSSPATCSTRSLACPPLSIVEQPGLRPAAGAGQATPGGGVRRQARRMDRRPGGGPRAAHRHDAKRRRRPCWRNRRTACCSAASSCRSTTLIWRA